MVREPEPREEREVLGVARREAVPSPEIGARPARSQSHQSEAGAAPSHCVDDAPVPHVKPAGHCIGGQPLSSKRRWRLRSPTRSTSMIRVSNHQRPSIRLNVSR